MARILVIEDRPEFQRTIEHVLGKLYELTPATTLGEARKILQTPGAKFDLVLLDAELPDGNGFAFIGAIQEALPETPVVFLTGKGSVQDRVAGFTLGADDYVVKPFEPLEFRARIMAKISSREKARGQAAIITFGTLKLDREQVRAFHTAGKGEARDLNLTPHEFRLLQAFVANHEKILSRDQLMTSVWGENVHVLERTVDRHISSLRKKLADCGVELEAVHGLGYRFQKRAA